MAASEIGRPFFALAGGSLAFLAALVIWAAAGPLKTADLWFHLKMGEVYASEGPWPAEDPLLHTASEDAPVQHEWLFGVAVYGLDRGLGFPGLRVAHGLAVALTLSLAWSIFRRESGSALAACFATSVFLVLAWWRFWQLRPDLVSIPATLALHRLLVEPGRAPSWGRVGGAVALLVAWANTHSLFAVGLLLSAAATVGMALRAWAARWIGGEGAAGDAQAARRLAAAVGLAALATFLNPRGFAQHLTFVTSTRTAAIWSIGDEWTPFDPFSWGHYGKAVSPLAWAATDLLFAVFLGVAIAAALRFWRRRSAETLRAVDPVLLAPALASLVAMLVSIRFLWMSFFPLLFVLRSGRVLLASRPGARGAATGLLALASLALALAFPGLGGFAPIAANVPRDVATYVTQRYVSGGYHEEGVRFLEDTGVAGNLFNAYAMGGFLGYRLAPRLRTFVDGRTEHYPPEVLRDYFRINRQREVRPDESSLEALDRREVDFYFGIGLPVTGQKIYTTARLERAEEWRLVSRGLRHAIYLRTGERNRENFGRIAAYYEREGVPFDPQRGLDVAAVLRARPDWAVEHAMLPASYEEHVAESQRRDPEARFRALGALAWLHTFLGSYEAQIALDREALALRPDDRAVRRRLVYALLRLDRAAEAQQAARELLALAPDEPRAQAFARAARAYARKRQELAEGGGLVPLDAPVNSLPLVTPRELLRCCADFL